MYGKDQVSDCCEEKFEDEEEVEHVMSARMNLNRLWSELEQVYHNNTSSKLIVLPELQDSDIEEQNRLNEELERLNS